METDVSSALSTLQLDPENSQALKVLRGLRAGNGSGVDPSALSRALTDARRWHRERGDFDLCVQLIDLELPWTTDAARRADLLHEKGRLLADELLKDQEAQACLREALENAPGHAAATEALTQMSLVQTNWQAIATRYRKQAEETGDKQLASSLYGSAAELHLKFAADTAEGESYLRKSLALDPKNRRASFHLERLLRDRDRGDEILSLLAQRASAAANREERALAEVAAAEVSLRLGKQPEALAHFRRALEANPGEAKALRPVVAALTEQKEWAELAKVLEAAARSRRGESDVLLLTQLATVLWRKLQQIPQAEAHFRKVRRLDPANRPMVEFYREYHGKRDDVAQLLTVLAAAQKADPDPERRIALGIEMARAAESRPQNTEKVIDIWKGLLRLKPHLPEAVEALRRLYARTQKWNALLELLKDDLEALPEDAVGEKVERYLEIVAIYRDRLKLDVMVVNTYLSILQLRPDHPEALSALASRYEAQSRWSDLIQILTRTAETTADLKERVALHRRIAGLWVDKLGKHQNAVTSLEKVLELDPGDADARARLRDLYVRSRSWRALLELTRREVAVLTPAERRGRLAEAAQIATERLGDSREAINLWNEVLAIDPLDPQALAGLAAIYDRERRWAALAEVLERQRQAVVGRDPAAEAALVERRGVILYEKLGASQAAIEAFRRAAALQPQNTRATRALREIYGQVGDLESLEALYAGQGNYEDLCDTLTALADRSSDLSTRARLLERVAAVASEKLRQPDRAIKAYERVLSADAANIRAAEALVPLYRAGQKWPRLLATYEVLLSRASGLDTDARLEMLKDARQIAEQRLGSKGLAFQWAARAFELAPADELIQSELERLAGEADEWHTVADLYAARLKAIPPEAEREGLLRRSLRVVLGKLHRLEEARGLAEALLNDHPADTEAQAALEQVFTQGQAWRELAQLLHRREPQTTDLDDRIKLLFRIAQLEEEKVDDLAAAARTYGAVVALDPANERALRAQARVLEVRQDWPALLEVLRRELAIRPVDEHGDLLLRIGGIQETRLADLEAAFATYREVLSQNPLSGPAVAGLERLVDKGSPHRVDIATLTYPYYQRTDNAVRMAASLEVLAEVAPSDAEKIDRLDRLAKLYAGPLKNTQGAYQAALQIFELDAAHRANREALAHYASDLGEVPAVAEKLRAAAAIAEDAGLRRDLLVEVAELHEQRLGDPAAAEAVYRQILDVEPLNPGAFRSLTRLYRDRERWLDLRALLDARQNAVLDPTERIDLLAQIAEIDETMLDDLDHAITSYEQMLELDPSDPRAYKALDRHYSTRERWRDREQLLERRLNFAAEGEINELELRRAEIRFQRFGDVEGALEILESIVRAAPEHEGARKLIEKALALPEHRRRAALILEPLYQGSQAWQRLVGALEIQREGVSGPEAAALLARVAELQESKLQARSNALASWRQALEADPGHPTALAEVERLAGALERWTELVDVYQELAFRRDGSDVAGRADLLSRAARLYTDRLGNRRAAIDVWKLVLSLDTDNVATAKPAADALEALYSEAGNTDALVKILRLQVGWADRSEDRLALLFRIAELEERSLGDPAAAVTTLRTVLDIDPASGEALDRLERIFETGGQSRARVDILRRRIDLAPDVDARQFLRRKVAELLEREVGDLDEAIAANLAILDESPEDVGALDSLSRLYEQQGRHNDRLEILERRLGVARREGAGRQAGEQAGERARALPGLASDRTSEIEVLRRIGDLLGGPLHNPGDALPRWREILTLAPGDPGALQAIEALLALDVEPRLRLEAAQALESVYERGGRYPDLAGVLRIYVDADEDPRARVQHLVQLAELEETRLGDTAAAFASYSAAIRDALGDNQLSSLLDAFERLGGTERAREVIALYREISPDVLDESLRLRLDRTVAAEARRVGDRSLAAEYYRRVLDRVPEDADALGNLEAIYREEDDAMALYEILARQAELASDPGTERRIRAELGSLAEQRLDRADEATQAWQRVFELAPDDRQAAAALDRLYTRQERWADLVQLIEQVLSRRVTESEALTLRFRLAEIQARRLADQESALAQLRIVLHDDPDHPGAIAMLEQMLDDPAVQGTAAELLEPVYAGRADWPALIKIGEIRLREVEDASQRLALTKRIARLHEEQLEDFDSALRWYGRVFQENPAERLSLEQLVRLAGKLNRWLEVGRLLSDHLTGAMEDTPAVLEVVRRAAEIFDLRVGDRDEARRHYRRLYEAMPDDAEVAGLFENALERWEAWAELRDFVEERAGRATDLDLKKALLRRSARLDEERLEDPDRAIQTLRDIIDLDPDDRSTPTAADELERLLGARERWDDLADHLEAQLARSSETADRDAIALRLAGVMDLHIGNRAAAVDRYADILERSPAHKDAIAALEDLLPDPDHRHRVATVLEPVYRRAGNWTKLVGALEAQLETVEDRDDRVRLLREMADIQQRLARVDSAFEIRARAWLVDVGSSQTLADMESLAMSAKLFGPLVQTLQKGADLAGDPDLQSRLWASSAHVLEIHLQDAGQAIEAWRQALVARPDDLESFLALERLLASGNRLTELAEVLEKHLDVANAPGERQELAKRIARLYDESLRQRDKAIAAWRTVLELDDGDLDALDALGRLYIAEQSWRELAEILQRKIELTPDAHNLRLLRLTCARLYDERLGDAQEAVAQLRAILEIVPNDSETLQFLDEIFTREAQHPDLLEVLDLRIGVEPNTAERDALAIRAARLLADELTDVEGAVTRYRDVLARTPGQDEARSALWTIARGDDYRASAVAALEPVLRAGGEWDQLVDLLELKLEVEDAPQSRLEILTEIARIEEESRRDVRRSFSAWARAFAEDPTDPMPRKSLERLATASADFSMLAAVYEERLEATFDSTLQRELGLRLGELYEGPLGEPERALDCYRKVLESAGDEPAILESIERILRRLDRPEELAEVLQRESDVATDPQIQAELLAQLGEVRLRRLDEVDAALGAFREALQKVPDHPVAHSALRELLGRPEARVGALDVLEPLAEERGDYTELAALYEHRLATLDERGERAAWLRRIAEVQDERLGQPPRALASLGRALAEEPVGGETVDFLERVASSSGRFIEAAQLVESVLDAADPASGRELAVRAARLYESGGDSANAERLYRRVLADDPENVDALAALEAFYRAVEDRVNLAEVLERRASFELDPAAKRSKLVEAAGLREMLGDVAAALVDWQTLRESEEGDAEVLSEMARLYDAQGASAELSDVLAERVRFEPDPATRAALLARVAHLKMGPLSDLDGAADALREALDSTPDEPALLTTLQQLEERRENWSTLQEVLLRRLGAAQDAAQIPILFKLAKNAEQHLSDLDQAVGFLHQILEIEEGNGMAFLELERILRENERWYDLIDVLGRHADVEARAGHKPTELALRVAIADIWEQKLDSADSAAEALEKVLEVQPEHAGALLSLARIHEAAERWDAAGEVLDRAARGAVTGPEAAEIHYRRAQISRAQGAPSAELEAFYRRALEADRTHRPSLLAIEGTARERGDTEALLQLLELRLDVSSDATERKPLLQEIAALRRDTFGDLASAVPYLEQLAALSPDDPAVAQDLADALAAAGRMDDATGILERLVDQLTKARRGKDVARLLQRLGGIAEAKGDRVLALDRYGAAYKLDPGHAGTLAALGRLALAQNDLETARRYYRSLLLQSFDEKSAGITKAGVYLALGRIHLLAGEGPKARNMFERGLETDPKNEDLKQELASLRA